MVLKISLPVLTEGVILVKGKRRGHGRKLEACCSSGQKSGIGSGQEEGRNRCWARVEAAEGDPNQFIASPVSTGVCVGIRLHWRGAGNPPA